MGAEKKFMDHLKEIAVDRFVGTSRLQQTEYLQEYGGQVFTVSIRRGDFLNVESV